MVNDKLGRSAFGYRRTDAGIGRRKRGGVGIGIGAVDLGTVRPQGRKLGNDSLQHDKHALGGQPDMRITPAVHGKVGIYGGRGGGQRDVAGALRKGGDKGRLIHRHADRKEERRIRKIHHRADRGLVRLGAIARGDKGQNTEVLPRHSADKGGLRGDGHGDHRARIRTATGGKRKRKDKKAQGKRKHAQKAIHKVSFGMLSYRYGIY